MTLTIANIVFDCHEPARLAAYWAAALNYATNTNDPDHAWAYDPRGTSPISCLTKFLNRKP
jgi:hypothetical protein